VSLKKDKVTGLSHTAVSSEAAPLTADLRKLALNSGWPAKLAEALTLVTNGDNELSIEYPDNLKQAIEDMEYGSAAGSFPNAIIRKFIREANSRATNYVDAGILEKLFDIEYSGGA
jgi:hypothetical protein